VQQRVGHVVGLGDQSAQPYSYFFNRFLNIKGYNRASMFTFNVIGPLASSVPSGCTYDDYTNSTSYQQMANATNGVLAVTHGGGNGRGVAVAGALNGTANAAASVTKGAQSLLVNGSASGNGSASASAGKHHASANGSASTNGSGLIGLGLGNGGVGGLPNGIRIINGVPCWPDGTPLTGPQASAVMAMLNNSGDGGQQGSSQSSSSRPSQSSQAQRTSSSRPMSNANGQAGSGQRHSQVSH
jgi:hypothetical protein